MKRTSEIKANLQKADAVPGRLNQVKFIRQRPGAFLARATSL